jgi:hypothetical protein
VLNAPDFLAEKTVMSRPIFFLLLLALPLYADIYERLDELPEHIRSGGVPRDGIPAMTNPQAVAPEQAHYLSDEDRVLGLYINGQARAYPHSLGWKHEVVNDSLGGQYISVTFCPLTSSGLAFDATDSSGAQIELGVSGVLINSNLVLYDRRDDRTLYPQMIHAAISGPYTGDQLELLPIAETTWELWKKMHPHTTIAQASTGLERYPSYIQKLYPLEAYRQYPYGDYRSNHSFIMFHPSTARAGSELEAKEMVLGLRLGQETKAYPFRRMPAQAIINDELAGFALLVLYDKTSHTAIPYSRQVGERTLTFARAETGAASLPIALRDRETGTRWDMLGRAVSGPLKGTQLQQLPAYNAMYFAWSAYWPETALWHGEGLADNY